jgi:hypothetical protein
MKPEDAAQLYDSARQKYAESTTESLLKLVHDNSGALSTAGGVGLGALGGYLMSRDDDWARRNPRAYRRAMLNNVLSGSVVGGGTGALLHGIYNAKDIAKDIKETPPIKEEFQPSNTPKQVAFVAKDSKGRPLSTSDAVKNTGLAATALGLGSAINRIKLRPSLAKMKLPNGVKPRTVLRMGKSTALLLAAIHGRNALDTLGAQHAPSWLNIPVVNSLATPVLPSWARAARQYNKGPDKE